MWQQGHVLKDHADGLGAQLPQGCRTQFIDVASTDPNLPYSGFDQAVNVAQQSGLATARQSDKAEYLALMYPQVGAGYRQHATILFLDLLAAETFISCCV